MLILASIFMFTSNVHIKRYAVSINVKSMLVCIVYIAMLIINAKTSVVARSYVNITY